MDTAAGDLAVDGTSVYWLGYAAGTVNKIPVAGGSVVTLATAQASPSSLALDAANVYWSNTGGRGAITKTPIGGGGTTVLATNVYVYGGQLAVDATSVYWAQGASIMKVAVTGGTPTPLTTLTDGSASHIAVDGAFVYVTRSSNNSPSFDALMKVPVRGGTSSKVADVPRQFGQSIRVAGGNLYWTTINNVETVPIGGGKVEVLACCQGWASRLTMDERFVYWFNQGGAILKVPIAGGKPTVLFTTTDENAPSSIAVDATSLYWGAKDGLWKLAK